MLNTIIRYIQGYLLIQVTGYSPERFLNLCSRKQIYLWGLEPKENSYEMFITIRGFRKLKPILKKTRTKVTILNRLGLPFFFHKYRKRKVFFFGILFCVIFIYVMSLFVWNIHIEGNFTRTDEVILEFLESKHIKHGMLKKKVNCERIVKDIRKEFVEQATVYYNWILAKGEARAEKVLAKGSEIKRPRDHPRTCGENML